MNYVKLIHFLENQKNFNSQESLKKALDTLKLNIDPKKVIVVAGTNGKGSTCATLATMMVEAGKNVGFFSSPHLIKTTERIKFNGIDISEQDFCNVFTIIREKIGEGNFSHFEWLTFMAVYYFFEMKKVDYAIFEVGLGGTYDSTNIIPHKFCVITRLALDHQDILGSTLLEIAKNKFGIISKNNIVFHTDFGKTEIEKLSIDYTEKYGAKFIKACDFSFRVDNTLNNKVTTDGNSNINLQQLKKYLSFFVETCFGKFKMNLVGKRAAENSALALTIFDYIVGNAEKYGSAIEKTQWPGRMQYVRYKGRDIFLSGDHNPNGIQSLIDILKYYDFHKVHFVVGICNDKDHRKMLRMLFDFPNANVYLTETVNKILSISEYDEEYLKKATYSNSDQIEVLNVAIKNSTDDDMIIVTGSLYLVGKIYSHLYSQE
ncbi:MAG: hypothetical protein IJ730_00870 [Alphaproteobacteria bacterium]|nr:hypothetical protein [Alphaproteobacteria bacterium]